jgi:hypothetical protein
MSWEKSKDTIVEVIARTIRDNERFLLGKAGGTSSVLEEVMGLVNAAENYVKLIMRDGGNSGNYGDSCIRPYLFLILRPFSYAVLADLLASNPVACFMEIRLMVESFIKFYYADLKYPEQASFVQKIRLLQEEIRNQEKTMSELIEECGWNEIVEDVRFLWRQLSKGMAAHQGNSGKNRGGSNQQTRNTSLARRLQTLHQSRLERTQRPSQNRSSVQKRTSHGHRTLARYYSLNEMNQKIIKSLSSVLSGPVNIILAGVQGAMTNLGLSYTSEDTLAELMNPFIWAIGGLAGYKLGGPIGAVAGGAIGLVAGLVSILPQMDEFYHRNIWPTAKTILALTVSKDIKRFAIKLGKETGWQTSLLLAEDTFLKMAIGLPLFDDVTFDFSQFTQYLPDLLLGDYDYISNYITHHVYKTWFWW